MEIFKKLKKYSWIVTLLRECDKEDRSNFIEGYKNRKRFYTSPDESLNADLKGMVKCSTCPNMCRFDCPALLVTKKETYSPANKARISLFMGMGRIPMDTESAIDATYACMNCDACRVWCPMDISTGDLLKGIRAELDKKDLIPERITKLKSNIQSSGSVFEQSPFTAESEFNHNDPKAEVFYYIGCMDVKHRPEAIRATMALLKHMNIPFCTHFESRECCAGPIDKVGFHQTAIELSARNQKVIKESKVKTVIATCPGCSGTLKSTYESLGHPIKPNVLHSIEFFSQKIKEGKLVLKNPVEKSISYHDPCLLSRPFSASNCVDEVREIIRSIPKLELREAYLHGKETRCCGMGGAYQVTNPENSRTLHNERFEQLTKDNPDYVVSGCLTCEYAFLEAKKEQQNTTQEVKDIVELIADSVGLNY